MRWYSLALLYHLSVLRAESCLLKAHMETQTKELELRLRQIEELKEKEKVANDSVRKLPTPVVYIITIKRIVRPIDNFTLILFWT